MKKTLDLHKTRHEDVRSKVIRFIEEHFNKTIQLKIITGKSTQMKAIVAKVLDEYKLEYSFGGIFGLNHGCITVDMEGTPMK